jgi:hypothetical protein
MLRTLGARMAWFSVMLSVGVALGLSALVRAVVLTAQALLV